MFRSTCALLIAFAAACIVAAPSTTSARGTVPSDTPVEAPPRANERRPARTYAAGLSFVGVRHLGGVGLGFSGSYRHPRKYLGIFHGGGELLLLHSGERRRLWSDTWNNRYDAVIGDVLEVDSTALIYLYEQVSMIGLGGTAYAVLRDAPDWIGPVVPGVTLAVTAGAMTEFDRVGVQSSELDYYYGPGDSDTNVSLRPYLRPQIILTQGPLGLSGGMTFFPVFASWSVGVSYGW